MAGSDRDYGDEGKTSFSKKSKIAPKTSPRPQARKEAVSTKSAAGPVRPKARPLGPVSSKRPMTPEAVNTKKTQALKDNMRSDLKLMGLANKKSAAKSWSEMTRSERRAAGEPVSPVGKFIKTAFGPNPNPQKRMRGKPNSGNK